MRDQAIWTLGLFVAIVGVAALVNRLHPTSRTQLRRVVILFSLYILLSVGHWGFKFSGETVWSERLLLFSQLLQAFTVVNLTATAFFSVLLPRGGITVPMIASDLIVGVGYIATTLGVLSTHGLNPTGAIASAAVVSAVLAISLQNTLGNILGGIALQLDGSVHEGDWVQLENGKQGRVRSVRWRHTVIETRDWSTMIVPNAQLLAATITILGKREGRAVPQRMWVWFNVDFRYPPTKVIEVITEAIVASPITGVAADPQPNCVCMDFTKEMRESFATYAVRYWLTDLAADDPTNSRVRARIFTALRRANIPLALPAHKTWVEIEDDAHTQRHRARLAGDRFLVLRELPLFRVLTDEEVHTLAEGLSHVIYCAGETCTRQGAVAHWLYILAKGTVEVRMTFDPDGPGPESAETRIVSQLQAPDVFGEMGLMTGAARTADVVAITDVDCYRLDKSTFEKVLLGRPEIAHELSEKLAQRRVGLMSVRENLDESAKRARVASERERIKSSIFSFFGLDRDSMELR